MNFSNASSTPGWANPTFDRYVRWDPTAPFFNSSLIPDDLVSSNYAGVNLTSLRAALYYAASTQTDVNLFTAAAGGPATFKVSTSTTAGSWFGGNRTLDNITPGTTANLVVLVWDSSIASNPLSAAARGSLFGAIASVSIHSADESTGAAFGLPDDWVERIPCGSWRVGA